MSSALQTWTSGAVTAAIERRTRTVVLLEGAPPALLDGLRAAVWAQPVLY